MRGVVSLIGASTMVVAGCSGTASSSGSAASSSSAQTLTGAAGALDAVSAAHPAMPGYTVSLFARGTTQYSHPDSVAVDGAHIYVGYQNVTAKDGSDHLTSTVVEYTFDAKVVKSFTVPGHSDGMRVDPASHLVWTTSNEDGNAAFNVTDPSSGAVTAYQLPSAPHGGGYDDVLFLDGKAFIVASAPALDANGNNVFPALDQVQLSGGTVVLTPVLMGNAPATDTTTNKPVTLNEVDPDSLSIDDHGQLVLVNQGGSELVFIKSPGTPQQVVSRIPAGVQLDDTVWSTVAQGRLLVTDGSSNATYWIHVSGDPGTVYTQTPDDSGVVGFVGTIDLKTGFVRPTVIGFIKPTGMAFVPDGQK
jgi:hypothetical protein